MGRVRYGGASGQLTVRADSGFYAHALVAVCREMGVRFSITIRQHTIPEQDWTPIPYWMWPGELRLIVRRVKPTPGSQLALFATYSYHGFITDRDGKPWNWRPIRRHAARTPFA